MGEETPCRSIIFHLALAQNQQGICQIRRQTDIVGDENNRGLMITTQAQQGVGHLFLGHAVYGGGRFIGQKQLGRQEEGEQESCPLHHASG